MPASVQQRSAKLAPPRAYRTVRRPRVVREIASQLAHGACWVAAPAGSGKTTAVLEFARSRKRPLVWYRVDAGDKDIANFFHYMAQACPGGKRSAPLPVFSAEYADQPLEFARRFFRVYYARLPRRTLLVLDDLHYVDDEAFRHIIAIALEELPQAVAAVCISRASAFRELDTLRMRGQLGVVDYATLSFTESEALALLRQRANRRALQGSDTRIAGGWAAGLVLVADRLAAEHVSLTQPVSVNELRAAVFESMARQLFEDLVPREQNVLCRVSVVSEFTGELAATLSADSEAPALLAALHRRQLFISRRAGSPAAYRFHDLFREFLSIELSRRWPAAECARLRSQAAAVLATQGRQDEAVDLAIAAADWELAQRLLLALAPVVIKEGRRARFTNWCQQLPADVRGANGWLCHWLGVANMSNDMTAEQYFEQAHELLNASHDDRGAYLTAVNAVLSKTDSWRTHTGLSRWTRRVLSCMDREPQDLSEPERALGWSGTLRAIEFADDYRVDRPTVERLLARTSAWLEQNAASQDVNLRVAVSQSLIEYAGTDGKRELFDRAVDSVSGDLRHRELAPWALGLWLVAFGSMSGRYFPFSRRGFPYPDAQAALRAAADIGVREQLRGVEFGALYHLQLLAKLHGSFEEFGMLVDRLAGIADSRYTTQVAIVADCQAARWTIEGSASRARPFCEQFMLAIEKADEPPIERWPHYITQFQVELRAGDYDAARNQLTAVLPQFDGEVRRRTEACVAIAEALRARDEPDAAYPAMLRRAMDALAASNYFSVLLNLPDVLAGLCDDALGIGAQDEYCKQLIARRNLAPPTRSAHWPWTLCIHVLGEFRLMRHGRELDVGPKAPRKSLDLLKLLASARDQRLALDAAHEAIWPDADGAQAKAACDQALHRLRKWLGGDDLVVQREGHLKIDSTRVWIDLQSWQQTLASAQATDAEARAGLLDRALEDFAGPLLDDDVVRLGLVRLAARIESDYLDATDQVFRQLTGPGAAASVGQRVYARALRHFPSSERALEGMLRALIAAGEHAAAVAEFRRFERTIAATRGGAPSGRLRHLIVPLLA